jgi:inner membrane transporter RhtA
MESKHRSSFLFLHHVFSKKWHPLFGMMLYLRQAVYRKAFAMIKAPDRPLAVAAVLTSIFSVQFGATLSERLFPVIGVEGTTACRQAFSAIALLLLFRPWAAMPERRHYSIITLYGVLLGVMNLTFYFAISRLPLGIAVALEFTGPLAVAIATSRKRIDFVWVACAVAGLAILLPWHGGTGRIDPVGVVMALVAGVCWGTYILVGQKVSRRTDGGKAVALGMFVSSLFTVPLGIVHAGAALWSLPVLALGAGAAIMSSAIPYSCEMWALKHIPAKTFSLMMSLEPAAGALMGFLLLREHLTGPQWLAIALVIAASAGSSLTAKQPVDETVA